MHRLWFLSILCLTATVGCNTSTSLFNGRDLTGWHELGSEGAWSVVDGVIQCNGKKSGYAWLSTDRKYGNFELTLDFKIDPGGNSGIFLRAPSREGRISMLGFEVQIIDDTGSSELVDVSGSVFRRIPASGKFSKPPGQWNTFKLTCRDRTVCIELNGHLISQTDMDTVKPLDQDPPMKNVPDSGYIGLQNHASPVQFRNIRIKEFPP